MDAIAATLLLFEQDRATRQLYRRELGRHWHVITVESATDCTNVLTQEVVHAVVFELGAASDDDWALLAEIIRLAAAVKTPVIVCSAIDARSRGYALGVSAYLVKPVLPQQLIAEVTRWLNDQAQREEPTRGDYVGTNPGGKPFAPQDK
jgi:DNA-binding NtrC family response regulator